MMSSLSVSSRFVGNVGSDIFLGLILLFIFLGLIKWFQDLKEKLRGY